MSRSLSGLFAATLLLVACAGSSRPVETARPPLQLADLYPFEPGNAWSYEVDTGEPSPTLAITRVESFDGHTAELRVGLQTVRYELRDEGIYVPAENAWLLKAPLEQGQRWPSRGGRTAEITALDESVVTPSGAFSGCLRVSEVGGRLDLHIRTVYCPGIGPVQVESTMSARTGEGPVTVRAALRGYQVDPARESLP